MKLRTVHIQNFRCIEDSTPFSIGQVTCLVGKNESGKTALLHALERLNPHDLQHSTYDKLRDYPRRYLSEYAVRHPDGEAVVLSTTWVLESEDRAALEQEFGDTCLSGDEVQISKSYGQTDAAWTVPLNEANALQYLLEQAGLSAEQRQSLAHCTTSEEVYALLGSAPDRGEEATVLLKRIGQFRQQRITLHAIDVLAQRLPKFLNFSHYSRMSGEVSIERLAQDMSAQEVSEGDQVFLDFLELAGTSLAEMQSATRYEELNVRCEAVSNAITDQLAEYWTQNPHLAVKVEVQAGRPGDPPPFHAGTVLHARIRNDLHRMTVPFSEQSAGFLWFFSFLVRFSQVRKKHGHVVLLLDEPGLNLHGAAQKDLLRYIEKELTGHQVIYTTHSPFMIPSDDLSGVRTVEAVVRRVGPNRFEILGTKVGDTALSTDAETLFPLHGALGYEITRSLAVGEYTLLVGGPADVLYLQAASAALKERGQAGLDPRWTLCPCGGLEKVRAFVSLVGGDTRHIAVLANVGAGHNRTLDHLKKSELLKSGQVYRIADFCDQDEADIEDLFTSDLFVSLLNSAYTLPRQQQIIPEKFEMADASTQRKVKKAEAYFRQASQGLPPFNPYTPAYWLLQNPKFLSSKTKTIDDTLERFSKIFTALDHLL